MRLFLPLLGACVVATLLIIDPMALGQLGYSCVLGGCGVRPVWIAAMAAAAASAWGLRAWLRGRPPRKRARRKPVTARRNSAARKTAAPAKSRARARQAKRPR